MKTEFASSRNASPARRGRHYHIFPLLLLTLLATPALAQHSVRQEARSRIASHRSEVTIEVPDGRFDVTTGVRRAAYRIRSRTASAGNTESAARSYLASVAPEYGWPLDLSDLKLELIENTGFANHLTFQQTHRGVPVHDSRVRLSLDRGRRPTMLVSGYMPDLSAIDPNPSLGVDQATRIASEAFTAGANALTAPVLRVLPTRPARLVWRLAVATRNTIEQWQVLVDAHSGELIELLQLGADKDGSGYVYDPDPLTETGATYGGSYSDNGDATTPELEAARTTVTLKDISQGTDGRYRLEGPYVRIVPATGAIFNELTYTPPSEASPDGFRYSRNDPRFEGVMAYYHIDQSQRYVQSLALGRPLQASPIAVNPRGMVDDNSQYFEEINSLIFGTGGIDDAEDATVIWHEYGHALLEGASPGLRRTQEGLDFHEGWSDYWAASYQRALAEAGQVQSADWRRIFRWDGNNGNWQGRRLDHPGRFPDQVAYPGIPNMYARGLLWATTLMEIYNDLGRTVTDRLNLASHAYLSHPLTFTDAAEALLQADLDLYGGAHLNTLRGRLAARGFVRIWEEVPIAVARASGDWERASDRWHITPSTPRTSTLVLQPLDLPANADLAWLELAHSFNLNGTEARLSLSRDDGRTWEALEPSRGEFFVGNSFGIDTTRFELADTTAAPVLVRLELVASEGDLPTDFWNVYSLRLVTSTTGEKFEIPREWALHAGYPEPFHSQTTLSYTVAEASDIRFEVYDVLGRRVDVLFEGRQVPGTYTVDYSAPGLPSGVYFVRLIGPEGVLTRRITVSR